MESILFSVAGALTAIVPGAVLGTVRTVPWFRHYPGAIYNAFRVTATTPRLGPNLRCVCLTVMPIGVMAAPVLMVAGGLFYGCFWSLAKSFDRNGDFIEGIEKMLAGMNSFGEQLVTDLMPRFSDYIPDGLKDGEKPVEIPLVPAIKSAVAGIVGSVIEAPLVLTLCVVRVPELLLRSLKFVWWDSGRGEHSVKSEVDGFELFMLRILGTVVVALGTAAVVVFVPPVTVLMTLGAQVYRTYKRGLRANIGSMVNDLHIVHLGLRVTSRLLSSRKKDEKGTRLMNELSKRWDAELAKYREPKAGEKVSETVTV